MRALQSVDVVEEAAEEVGEVRRPVAEPAAVVAEGQVLAAALSLESLASPSKRRHNVSARRLSVRIWLNWPKHLPMAATH
jgi:hypothetical protein